jgi:Peptidase A4 family
VTGAKRVLVAALGAATLGLAALAVAQASGPAGDDAGVRVVRGGAALAAPQISSNWSGYAATGTNASTGQPVSYTSVTGTWTQPAATCGAGTANSASAFWVGLGGFSGSAQALEQIGTDSDCDENGSPSYFAWYELVPADAVILKARVMPGDTVTASVNILPGALRGATTVELQIINRTRNWRITRKIPTSTLDLTSADWIGEAPSLCSGTRCRPLALTNFGSAAFTKIAAIGDGLPGTLTNTAWTANPVQLVPSSHSADYPGPDLRYGTAASTAGSSPGAISPDGRAFGLAWQAVATPASGTQ